MEETHKIMGHKIIRERIIRKRSLFCDPLLHDFVLHDFVGLFHSVLRIREGGAETARYAATRACLRMNAAHVSITRSCWAGVISGNIGSASTERAASSLAGKSPGR